MEDGGVTGELLQTRSEVEFDWRIANFMSLSDKMKACYKSQVFQFMDSLWHFEVRMNVWISVYLTKDDSGPPKSLHCTLDIKAENSLVKLNRSWVGSNTYENCDQSWGWAQFVKRSELMERKSSLLPSGVLTIKCCLKSAESKAIPVMPRPIKLKELDTLSVELGNLLMRSANCDVTLNVQNKTFRAHRSILIARSEVFASMFEHELSESKTGVVDIVDCDPDTFEDFLHYLYTGKIEDATVDKALHLYKTADKYAVRKLKSMCVEFMVLHLSADNVCVVATLAHRRGEDDLLASAQAFFNMNLAAVLSTDSWDVLATEEYNLSKRLLKEMASQVKIQD